MAPSRCQLRPKCEAQPKRKPRINCKPRAECKPQPPITQDLQTFHFFPRLPVELRLQIYTLALSRRTILLSTREITKCPWNVLNSVTGIRYPLPNSSDFFHNGRRIRGPHAILERIFARTTSVSLLEVCVESRRHVLDHHGFCLESTRSTPRDLRLDAQVLEDPRAERGWALERHMETPRFLVRRKQVEALTRINLELDVVLLDPGKLHMLYITEKWMPMGFKHRLRYLAMTLKQCCQRSADSTHGSCLLQFRGLEELIILIEPGTAELWEAIWGYRIPLSKIRIKRRVEALVKGHLEILVSRDPNWRRPSLRMMQDAKSLEKELK